MLVNSRHVYVIKYDRWTPNGSYDFSVDPCSFSVGRGRGGKERGRAIDLRRRMEEFAAEGGEPIPRLKIFSARLIAAGFFEHRWKVVRLVSGFLFFNGPPATVTPVAEGGGCSWRPVQTKSRSTCHLIPTTSRAGLISRSVARSTTIGFSGY